jgi:hypothetical protein
MESYPPVRPASDRRGATHLDGAAVSAAGNRPPAPEQHEMVAPRADSRFTRLAAQPLLSGPLSLR